MKTNARRVLMATKVQTFFSFRLVKALKYYIPGPGKGYALECFQLKITNNYQSHFVIFINLLHKAFFMKEPL